MTGLRLTYTKLLPGYSRKLDKALCVRRLLFIFCALVLIANAALMIIELHDSKKMSPEAILIFYLTVSPILAIFYITIVVIIFRYMNPDKNPSLEPERIKTGV